MTPKPTLACSFVTCWLGLLSCGLNTEEPITFDNPFCQEVDMTFTKTSTAIWSQDEEVYNVIRAEEYLLTEIVITDPLGLEAEEIILTSPDGCEFRFPDGSDSDKMDFTSSTAGGVVTYTANNVKSGGSGSVEGGGSWEAGSLDLFCEDHHGTWTLEVKYRSSEVPSSEGTSDALHVTYEVCFEFAE